MILLDPPSMIAPCQGKSLADFDHRKHFFIEVDTNALHIDSLYYSMPLIEIDSLLPTRMTLLKLSSQEFSLVTEAF